MPRLPLVLSSLSLIAAGSIAVASSPQDGDACANPSTPTEVAIAACTAIAEDRLLRAPVRAEALSHRGNWHLSSARTELAIRDLSQAIELDPSATRYRIMRGNIYATWFRYADAIADYTVALEKQPDDADMLTRRSYAYYENKDLDRSIADDTRVIALEPRNAAAFYSRGVSYQDKQQFNLARQDFNHALELNGSFYYDEFEPGCVARNANGIRELKDWPRCEKH
jgi:tetratricopeptide (TPR) repeat protein